MIYLNLMGRIGNQLFQYAFACAVQEEIGQDTKIVIDESSVIDKNWINSLREYSLPNVEFVQNEKCLLKKHFGVSAILLQIYRVLVRRKNTLSQYKLEKMLQPLFNHFGLIAIERGYWNYKINRKRNIILDGYFQSERYFERAKEKVIQLFDLTDQLESVGYPFVEMLRERNSVCISIKVEHNAEQNRSTEYSAFDVCHEKYYEEAIEYILQNVEKPLFFLCSDDIEYARNHYLKNPQYDVVCQSKDFPVHYSLAAMSLCKHFIINNTTFGWWAQYLSKNENKIVVAPSRWKNNRDPVNIYDNQNNWHLVEC